MEITIEELIWAQWNIDHMYEKHSVTPSEVIESMNDAHAIIAPAKQERIMVLGRSGKRLLATVLQKQDAVNTYHVVTSRDMSKKERALYRAQEGVS